ncbi:RluA family pseudouridine synthase [Enterococcus sp. BWB1-3]|uniref:RluA family pseudouridine synthase n=1 Tax=Enterococcus sp. BWB1-3 TaxID=2787713 RepID=UPI0019242A05|nr:RluA family pseudouridine synthase [Enterococcus sp. BWB1-3]MBL1229783.1 RluA family pseudouridine synthase [Enterococcus sp. BWB1-3]
MEFQWVYKKEESRQIKSFLKEQGVSKGLLAKIKFQGGRITVNDRVENVLFKLSFGDQLKIVIPDEGEHETMLPSEGRLDILFEDEHFLIVNKPAGIASIPSQYHTSETMANQVKGYYKRMKYSDQIVHIVTRLDRDTSGVMLFAKHGFAHALLDQQLRKKQVIKIYYALVGGAVHSLAEHEEIIGPISRDTSSLLKRMVSENGKYAKTEYWLAEKLKDSAYVKIQLHTGRTHQIRVHFESIGCPLLGDEMYGGPMDLGIRRQALHCSQLSFIHPFTQEKMRIDSPVAEDMKRIIEIR